MLAIWKRLSIFSLLLLTTLSAQADEAARNKIVDVVNQFETVIVANKARYSEDREALIGAVDKILTPVIDFELFAKMVMGKYYRASSDSQRIRFAEVTKRTLLDRYGTIVLEFDPKSLEILPLGPQSGREVRVELAFNSIDLGVVDITFYMLPSETKGWLLSNVTINQINLGLSFRNSFADMMKKNRNDYDKAIDAWQLSLEG